MRDYRLTSPLHPELAPIHGIDLRRVIQHDARKVSAAFALSKRALAVTTVAALVCFCFLSFVFLRQRAALSQISTTTVSRKVPWLMPAIELRNEGAKGPDSDILSQDWIDTLDSLVAFREERVTCGPFELVCEWRSRSRR